MGHSPAQCLARARCARRPLGMAGAGVAAMGRQTVGARLAPRHGNSRAGGDAGGRGPCRCRRGRLVVHASHAALRDLLVSPPGLTEYDDNGISSIKPLKIVFSESAAPLEQMQKAVTSGVDAVPADRRHVVLDDRQGTAVHAEGRLAGRRRVLGAVRKRRVVRRRSRARELRFAVRSQPFSARISREPVLPGSARPEPEEAGRDA